MTTELKFDILSVEDGIAKFSIFNGDFLTFNKIIYDKNEVYRNYYEVPVYLIKDFFSNMQSLLYARYVKFTFSMKNLGEGYFHPDITFEKVFNSDIVIMKSSKIFYHNKFDPEIKGIEYLNESRSALYPENLLKNIDKILK